jgi:6-phosphogluconolactonase
MQTRFYGVRNVTALEQAARARILASAQRAIDTRGEFMIALAGGSTPRGVYASLRSAATDWTRWHVYFGDERCLPSNHPERNSRMAKETWLEHVPIPEAQIHPLGAEHGAIEGARAALALLRDIGPFDLVLLGLGEDGHTASLFPDHDWGEQADAPDALPVFDAPKPPPERVSLSAARLSRAREVLFMAHGDGKRDALARWRRGERLPAAAIRPAAGVDVLVTEDLLTTHL